MRRSRLGERIAGSLRAHYDFQRRWHRVHAPLWRRYACKAGLDVSAVADRAGLPERVVELYLDGDAPCTGRWAMTLNNAGRFARGLGLRRIGDLCPKRLLHAAKGKVRP